MGNKLRIVSKEDLDNVKQCCRYIVAFLRSLEQQKITINDHACNAMVEIEIKPFKPRKEVWMPFSNNLDGVDIQC